MKRALLLLPMMLLSTSCAHGASHYRVPSITGTSPLYDDNRPTCAAPSDLWPVGAGAWRRIIVAWVQAGVTVRRDSVDAGAGSPFSFSGFEVQSAATVVATATVRDSAGVSCPAVLNLAPLVTLVKPAPPTLAVGP
jgi:hypothetical protein